MKELLFDNGHANPGSDVPRLKIAITTPTNWPRVRRGAERFLNDFARYLAGRGHRVTILSAHPGESEVIHDQGYSTVLKRQIWQPWMEKAGFFEFHLFFFTVLAHLPRQHFDVVFSTTFMDAYAASLVRRFTGTPCIFWVNGLPPVVRYHHFRSAKGKVFRRAILRADEVISLSGYMQRRLTEQFGRGGIRIFPGVDLESFPLSRARDHSRPIILCTAALADYRKGGRLLMRAFNRVKMARPEVVLQLSSGISPELRSELLESVAPQFRGDVQFLGLGELRQMPELYGRAAISVLPSLWEPFGLALAESLAVGTPVVGTRDGAIPEILAEPGIGRLFDPGPTNFAEPSNDSGLADAMIEALSLSRDPATAERCRRSADRFSWSRVGPQFENVLTYVAAGKRPAHQEPACVSF